MAGKMGLFCFFVAVILVTMLSENSEARYLPARGSPERLEKLRELLKEFIKLLENEIDKEDFPEQGPRWHPESKLFYKREVPSAK